MLDGVDVELLVIPDCPGADRAAELLRTALDGIGLADCSFTTIVVDSPETALAHRFGGSPAFLVNGLDLFPAGDGGGSMACRIYSTPEGPRNVPALSDLRQALREQEPG